MKKILISIFSICWVLLTGVSVVSPWDSATNYDGEEIVSYENRFYLSQWWGNRNPPSSGTSWIEIDSFLNPAIYSDDSTYVPGDAVLYNDETYVARSSSRYSAPTKNDSYGNWILADKSLVETGPIQKLPKDPGEAGLLTVLGIDSDTDGIRDDIQREITFAFPEYPYKRAAYMLIAKYRQSEWETYLNNPDVSAEELMPFSQGIMVGLMYTIRSGADADYSFEDFEERILNTPERLVTQYSIDSKYHERVITTPETNRALMNQINAEFTRLLQIEQDRQH